MGLFAARVSARFPLSAEETAFLDSLEARQVRCPPRHMLCRSGEPAGEAFVLLDGWAMSYSQFEDGTHQVRRLHFPGDLLAMPSVPMRHYAEEVETLCDVLVAPFPKDALAGLFALPRLAGIMYMFAQAERISAGDRLACLGRTDAKGRLAYLVIDILNRLRATGEAPEPCFRMHLTREQMAHVTGMTPVHASRMWSALIDEGLIACNGTHVTILDEPRLLRLSGYQPRDRDFDHHWLARVQEGPPQSPRQVAFRGSAPTGGGQRQ